MKTLVFKLLFLIFGLGLWNVLSAQSPQFTRQDSLRGGWHTGRVNWNVLRYDITVQPDIKNKYIKGTNQITLYDSGFKYLQIDLQQPMEIDSIIYEGKAVNFTRDGNVFFVFPRDTAARYKISPGKRVMSVYFQGHPREAKNPPWDGGWIWKIDKAGNPFISIACQGLGASVWYPCKDSQADEPDSGASLTIIVPDSLMGIGNGRLVKEFNVSPNLKSIKWEVKSPINNYNIIPYIGKYAHFESKYKGEKGLLTMDYYPLAINREIARKQIAQGDSMMRAFEYWFGPYPFYNDGFKLIEAPHLGMEHQSAVAYGNNYKYGYAGRDLSQTGEGLKFDFILVHESGHEWFANNISSKDIADMWIHESFTNYSETLYLDYFFGKEAANRYLVGSRKNIKNDGNIIGYYDVNNEGSGDMYPKGGSMLHFIRQVMNNDEKFRQMLRGLNKDFFHQTVTAQQIENYINNFSGINFLPLFNQYLRSVKIPTIRFKEDKKTLYYKIENNADGFKYPIRIFINKQDTSGVMIKPVTNWKKMKIKKDGEISPRVYDAYYVNTIIE